jgi:predicted HicB family RNase H-like nuclease
MRTTIDLPPTLMRAAKARAAEHGESLKDLVNRAVAHEVGLPSTPKGKAGRVTLR